MAYSDLPEKIWTCFGPNKRFPASLNQIGLAARRQTREKIASTSLSWASRLALRGLQILVGHMQIAVAQIVADGQRVFAHLCQHRPHGVAKRMPSHPCDAELVERRPGAGKVKVDFLLDCRSGHTPLVNSSDTRGFLISEASPISEPRSAGRLFQTQSLDVIGAELERQKAVADPLWQGKDNDGEVVFNRRRSKSQMRKTPNYNWRRQLTLPALPIQPPCASIDCGCPFLAFPFR